MPARVPASVARRLRFRRLSLVSTLLAASLTAVAGCAKEAPKPPPPKPVEVTFIHPVQETVTEYEEFSGRSWSLETVDLRSRVTGYLKAAKFKDGDLVKQGDVLFDIEDETFKAELERATAAVDQAEAKHRRLTNQLKRAEKLLASRSISQEEFETLSFDASEAAAAKASAAAVRDLAQLNLDFTTIEAPISGRIGRRLVDPGNLVKEDDTSLAIIVSLNEIYAYFDFDERAVLKMRKLVEKGRLKSAPDFERPVQVALAGDDQFRLTGKIDWVDNQVDPGTGTLRARVKISNENQLMSPGMFVRLRVPVGPEEPAMLIPEEALGSDQGLRYVYLVNSQNEIEYRRVQIGWLNGRRRVIESGLELNDKVVLTGLQRIRAKSKVEAKPHEAEATARK